MSKEAVLREEKALHDMPDGVSALREAAMMVTLTRLGHKISINRSRRKADAILKQAYSEQQ